MDGSNLKEITRGKFDQKPTYSPDGNWIVYSSEYNGKRVIMRMSTSDGSGKEVALTSKYANAPVVSPDGKLIACFYQEETLSPLKVAILPLAGDAPLQTLNLPNIYPAPSLHWRPDGRALSYLDPKDNAGNVWICPLDRKPPWKFTDFQEE